METKGSARFFTQPNAVGTCTVPPQKERTGLQAPTLHPKKACGSWSGQLLPYTRRPRCLEALHTHPTPTPQVMNVCLLMLKIT